ncbi:mono/diheme cytochrome c family protein [Rhodovulum iodosum]|uniref:Mono/diheme cytochrome c family protein n=1 Tax=Rhodovulum iodosum TaxID=68291 RepID=A0ABV3XW34_9RHOB|nr:cytochrome c [Rhodovulum robiginosum]RSK36482.1 cytochrome c [Rhodovulum robiginosum]
MLRAASLLFVSFAVTPAWATENGLGQGIFNTNCIICHGETGAGDDETPDIRGIPLGALRRALHGFDKMPEFALDDDAVAALHAYLRSLDPES